MQRTRSFPISSGWFFENWPCPHRVINGSRIEIRPCPHFPDEQTFTRQARTSQIAKSGSRQARSIASSAHDMRIELAARELKCGFDVRCQREAPHRPGANKRPPVAVIAIARELAGFLWAIAHAAAKHPH
jgi:hypothetical protein